MISLLLAAVLLAAPAEPATDHCDTLVVCPPEFQAAMVPWLEHRAGQGHRIGIIEGNQPAGKIRDAIRKEAESGELKFVLLVGDAPAGRETAALAARRVPTHQATAKVNIQWGSEPKIATDNWYADLDDDQIPDLAIGRLPVDNGQELSSLVKRILVYEGGDDHGAWRRKINFVAGLGGFGQLADFALEASAKAILTDGIPAGYVTSMTYASWRSPYCPAPSNFHQTTLDRLNEGCLFWVYIGHGNQQYLDDVHAPDGAHPIFNTGDVDKLQAAHGAPIALFLACYTGAFDKPEDCLAEDMLRREGGPVAVVAGSRVTMPYAMSVLGTAFLRQCFVERQATLGEMILHSKRNSILAERTTPKDRMLDTLAAAISPKGTDLLEERREHLLLFNLLGDPLLRLRHPRPATLAVKGETVPGGVLEVSGSSPVDGQAELELVVRRDRLTFKAPARRDYDSSDAGCEECRDLYERANDHRLSNQQVNVVNGRFAARVTIPADAHGDCHLRVYIRGQEDFALGAEDLVIRKAASKVATKKTARVEKGPGGFSAP